MEDDEEGLCGAFLLGLTPAIYTDWVGSGRVGRIVMGFRVTKKRERRRTTTTRRSSFVVV